MKAPFALRSGGRFALLVFAGTHFLVDLASAALLFHSLAASRSFVLCLLFYNFFAFAAEAPLGIAVDRWLEPRRFATLGCWLITGCALLGALVAPALGSSAAGALIFASLVGVGNGIFHVGAGAQVIRRSADRSGPLGVFVAPGALGVFLGMALGKSGGVLLVIVPVLLAGCGVAIWAQARFDEAVRPASRRFIRSSRADLSLALSGTAVAALACLIATVILRSYAGFSFTFSWKVGAVWPVALVLGVVAGKILGGFVGDRLGLGVAAAISLGGAALLFLLPQVPVAGVFAVLLFNMTMPLTLRTLADLLPQTPGFAFGALTFALYIGALPALLGLAQITRPGWPLTLLSLGSLAILLAGLFLARVRSVAQKEQSVLEQDR